MVDESERVRPEDDIPHYEDFPHYRDAAVLIRDWEIDGESDEELIVSLYCLWCRPASRRSG